MGLLSGRLGMKKLAFLQERDDWLSAASAKFPFWPFLAAWSAARTSRTRLARRTRIESSASWLKRSAVADLRSLRQEGHGVAARTEITAGLSGRSRCVSPHSGDDPAGTSRHRQRNQAARCGRSGNLDPRNHSRCRYPCFAFDQGRGGLLRAIRNTCATCLLRRPCFLLVFVCGQAAVREDHEARIEVPSLGHGAGRAARQSQLGKTLEVLPEDQNEEEQQDRPSGPGPKTPCDCLVSDQKERTLSGSSAWDFWQREAVTLCKILAHFSNEAGDSIKACNTHDTVTRYSLRGRIAGWFERPYV